MHRFYRKFLSNTDFCLHNEIYCYEPENINRSYCNIKESKKFLMNKYYAQDHYANKKKEIITLETNLIRIKEKELI